LAVLPCALLAIVAGALLGRPLGQLAFGPGPAGEILPGPIVRPEPTEHARYAIAVLAPLLLAGVVALLARRRPLTVPARVVARAVAGVQALLVGFVAFLFVAQRTLTYRSGIFTLYPTRLYFTWTAVAVAALAAGGCAALLRREHVVRRVRALGSESTLRRRGCLALAALFVAVWLLSAFNTDASLGRAALAVQGNIFLWFDEAFAILNGLAPLAGFHAQYAQLWPYLPAGTMALFGASFGVYAGTLLAVSAVVMLAMYATLRRVARSSPAALALFLPFAATSFFKEEGTFDNRYTPANLFTMFPLRYGGPYLLAWLLCRHLDGRAPRRLWLVFLAAGIVVLNNAEFGIPAFAATCAALAVGSAQPLRGRIATLVREAAIGAAAALLAVAALTLAVEGELPHLGQLLEFPRIYGVDGVNMAPMPPLGVHQAVYLTFAGALVLAAVRALAAHRDVLLTGMLGWSGTFGLGVGAYYVGRSHPDVLIDVFSAWALALALLVVAVVRALLARPLRRPALAELAVLFGFGLAVCSLAQTPAPWRQVARLERTTAPPRFVPVAMERYLAARTRPGEQVAIFGRLGHRAAYDVGIVDVSPYNDLEAMFSRTQWRGALDALRARGVRKLFLLTDWAQYAQERALVEQAGYRRVETDAGSRLALFVR